MTGNKNLDCFNTGEALNVRVMMAAKGGQFLKFDGVDWIGILMHKN